MVNWTDERVERLTAMWTDGFAAAEIAAVIGGGATKNSVIGKVHRLELPSRKPSRGREVVPADARKRMSARVHRTGPGNTGSGGGLAIKLKRGQVIKRRPENVRPPMQIVAPPAPVEPLNLTLMQLGSGQCHYIAGEPSSGYCGHPAEDLGRPYCAFHLRLCYRRLDPELSRRHRRSAEYMARVGA